MIREISKDQILERIRFENPWSIEGKIAADYDAMLRRLYFELFKPITSTDEMIGNMVETAIFAQWMHRDWFTPYYARWSNGEVDMVGLSDNSLKPLWALEIKWSDRYFEKPKELKSLIKFCQENHIKTPIVPSLSKEGEIEYADVQFQFLPSSAYAYTVGKNTLDIKGNK